MESELCYVCRKARSAIHLVSHGKPVHVCPQCHSAIERAAVVRRDHVEVRKERGKWCVTHV
jgi:hypothetical protein